MARGRSQPTPQIRRWPPLAARCGAIDALDFAAQENIQVHGGIGITWESNCHLFLPPGAVECTPSGVAL